MSVLIKDMEKPKFCYAVIDGESEYCPFVNTDGDCVLLLKKGICEGSWTDQYSKCPIETPEPCEDTVPRTSVEYICRKNTVSTNPYEHKYYDKFIQFMNDPEISDFGRWQHSNGFNTALVAVKCDLDKVPSVTPKAEPKTGKWIVTNEFDDCCYAKCNQCNVTQIFYYGKPLTNYCPNCGCQMGGEE